ncbi:MAG: hypothetical protein OEX19_09390 [Gammaproteobacteria bacterium]|nr:hypothetical protein [Gammaproteobacteria bacterium]
MRKNIDDSRGGSATKIFGIRDWECPSLLREYYPDDLPEDWRLDYYANEFSVLAVPANKWRALSEEDLEQWREDAGDQMLFLFETGGGDNADAINVLKKIFSTRFVALSEESPDSTGLVQKRTCLTQNLTLCVFYITPINESKTYLKELRAELEAQLASCVGVQRLIFIVQGEERLVETLESVQILLDLMG